MSDLTCLHCGSTRFLLVIVHRQHRIDTRPAATMVNVTATEIQCVNHEAHIADGMIEME